MNRKLSQCIFMFLLLLFFVSRGQGATYALGPIKVYEIPFEPQEYYLSPFDDGKIWLSKNRILQEFDPASGKITDLTTLLGDFAAGYGYIIKDTHDSNLFFMTSSKGLLVYDKNRHSSRKYLNATRFNDAHIFLVRPEKESIWIGTDSDGLHRINRADWKIARIEKTKTMSVTKIVSSGHDEIYFFDQGVFWEGTITKIWYRYRAGTDELQKIPPPTLPDQGAELKAVVKSLVKSYPYNTIRQIADDTDMIWFTNQIGLGRVEKKNNQITYLDLGWSGSDPKMRVDKSNIWLFFDGNLVTLDKASAATLLSDEVTINTRHQKLRDMEENLRYEQNSVVFFQRVMNLIELYNTYVKVKSVGRKQAYYAIIDHMQGKTEGDKIPLLVDYLQSAEANPATVPYIWCGLLCAHSLAFNPEQALRCYEMLKLQYPDSGISRDIDLRYPEDIQVLKKTVEDLKRIQTGDLMPDQKLWETGQAYLAMARVNWNGKYMGPDLTYPHSFVEEILKQYPNSAYADNAWWEIHLNNWIWDGGIGMEYLSFAVPGYKEFLSLYPTSELAPSAKLLMSSDILMAIEYSEDDNAYDGDKIPPDQRREYLETARKMCTEAIQAGLNVDDMTVKDRINEPPTETLAKIEKYLQKYTH